MRLRSLVAAMSLAAALLTAPAAATPTVEPALAPIDAPAPPDLHTSVAAARSAHVFAMLEGAFKPATRTGIDRAPVRFVGIASTDDGAARQAIVLGLDSATAAHFTGYVIAGDPLRLSERAAGTISGTREHGMCRLHADLLNTLLKIELEGPCTANMMTGTFTTSSVGQHYTGSYVLEFERNAPGG